MSSLPTALEVLLGDTDVLSFTEQLRRLLQHPDFEVLGYVDVACDEDAGWVRLRRRSGDVCDLRIGEVEREGDTLRRWELGSVAGPAATQVELIAVYLTDWLRS